MELFIKLAHSSICDLLYKTWIDRIIWWTSYVFFWTWKPLACSPVWFAFFSYVEYLVSHSYTFELIDSWWCPTLCCIVFRGIVRSDSWPRNFVLIERPSWRKRWAYCYVSYDHQSTATPCQFLDKNLISITLIL